MPSTGRRAVLVTLGTVAVGGLAGCSSLESAEPPAGSLRFHNDDDLPHSIRFRVLDVGAEPGDPPTTVEGDVAVRPAQRNLSASTTVDPGERETYEGVFTEPVWYAVRFGLDGRTVEHGTTVYHPAPPGRESGRFLYGTVSRAGEFSWGIASTTDPGSFEFGSLEG